MDNAFAWLRDIAEWLGRFVPRWEVCDTRNRWIKWVRGSRISTGGPGIVVWWPVTTICELHAVARQSRPLPSQVVTTADGVAVAAGGLLIYRIDDIEKAVADGYDPDDTISEIAASALHDTLQSMTWEEIRTIKPRMLETRLRNAALKDLDTYGTRVIRFTLTTCARCNVQRVIRSTFEEGDPVVKTETKA
jgi:regulator of protease activity HflC (stomatin/prohibitin superfamily)